DAYIHVAARSVLPALILRPLIGSSVFLHALDIIARLFEHFDDLCAVVLKIQGGGRNVNARFSHLRTLGTNAAIWNDISASQQKSRRHSTLMSRSVRAI